MHSIGRHGFVVEFDIFGKYIPGRYYSSESDHDAELPEISILKVWFFSSYKKELRDIDEMRKRRPRLLSRRFVDEVILKLTQILYDDCVWVDDVPEEDDEILDDDLPHELVVAKMQGMSI